MGKFSFILRENHIKLLYPRAIVHILKCIQNLWGALIKLEILSPSFKRDSELVGLAWAQDIPQGFLMILLHGTHMENTHVSFSKEEEEMVVLKTKISRSGNGGQRGSIGKCVYRGDLSRVWRLIKTHKEFDGHKHAHAEMGVLFPLRQTSKWCFFHMFPFCPAVYLSW